MAAAIPSLVWAGLVCVAVALAEPFDERSHPISAGVLALLDEEGRAAFHRELLADRTVLSLTEQHLQNILGVARLGPRLLILQYLERQRSGDRAVPKRRASTQQPAQQPPEGILMVGFKNEALGKQFMGKTVAEAARLRGQSPEEAIIDLVLEDDSRIQCVYFSMSMDNIRKKIALPWVSFCSDAASLAPALAARLAVSLPNMAIRS